MKVLLLLIIVFSFSCKLERKTRIFTRESFEILCKDFMDTLSSSSYIENHNYHQTFSTRDSLITSNGNSYHCLYSEFLFYMNFRDRRLWGKIEFIGNDDIKKLKYLDSLDINSGEIKIQDRYSSFQIRNILIRVIISENGVEVTNFLNIIQITLLHYIINHLDENLLSICSDNLYAMLSVMKPAYEFDMPFCPLWICKKNHADVIFPLEKSCFA